MCVCSLRINGPAKGVRAEGGEGDCDHGWNWKEFMQTRHWTTTRHDGDDELEFRTKVL